jgi:dethiobiotin synthetase
VRSVDIAAMRLDADTPTELAELEAAFARLSCDRDGIIVEGAGGLLLPISGTVSYAQLFARLKLEIIIVASDTLGVINKVLLAGMAAVDHGLVVKGIVLNSVPAADNGMSQGLASNHKRLQQVVPRVPVISFSEVGDAQNLSLLVREVEKSGLGMLALGNGDQPERR